MNPAAPTLVDVVVVGAGTAGLAAYRTARSEGRSALVIEAGPGGTTCAREGCMPSKLLLAAAHAAHAAADAPAFGVHPAGVEVRFDEVMDRVRRERDRFVGFVLRGVDALPPGDHLHGRARLDGRTADGRVVVRVAPEDRSTTASERVLHARTVVLATGSSPVRLPFEPALGDRVSHAADVFGWTTRPERLVVFGPGAIGLELGQAMHRLGSRVQILGLGGLVGPLSDPHVRTVATAALSADVPLDPDARDLVVSREGDEIVVSRTLDGETVTQRFDHALVAVGRRPNLHGLGLATLGLDPNRPLTTQGLDLGTLQLGGLPLFLAGDVTGDRALLHEAADEGRLAGRNAASFPTVTNGLRRTPLGIVFSDPQLAVVGERWADLDPTEVVVGAVDLSDQGRSRVMREHRGWMHVYVDRRTGHLRGAELAHPRAEHLAHLLAWVHQLAVPVPQVLDLPFYHPVIEEGLRTALRDAHRQLGRLAA